MKNLYFTLLYLTVVLIFSPKCIAQEEQQLQGRDRELTLHSTTPYHVDSLPQLDIYGKPLNVVLMIGDGMSLSHISSLMSLNRGHVWLQNATVTGLMETCALDSLITDSAASGTAMATGRKAKYHTLGVDSDGTPRYNLTDFAFDNGLRSGVVSVCRLWDATPAAFCCHNLDRDASQEIIADYVSSNADLVIGGGAYLMSEGRTDGRDLFSELQAKGFNIATTMEELKAINKGKIFAALASVDLPEPKERGAFLTDVSLTALNHFSQDNKGFFLMIEGSQLDDYAHANNLDLLMQETADFDQAAGAVMKWAANNGNTLVIITADHETGGLTLVGGDHKGTIVGKFSTGGHSGRLVPVYVYGPGAIDFTGIYSNADLYHKITNALINGHLE